MKLRVKMLYTQFSRQARNDLRAVISRACRESAADYRNDLTYIKSFTKLINS